MDENGDCEREREGEGGWCWAKVSLIRFCFGASFARISCGNSASTEGSTWLGRTNCVPVMLRGLYLVSDASVRVEERAPWMRVGPFCFSSGLGLRSIGSRWSWILLAFLASIGAAEDLLFSESRAC